MREVKDVLFKSKKETQELLKTAKNEIERIKFDGRLTEQGKQAEIASITEQTRDQVQELMSGLIPRAEAAVSVKRDQAKKASSISEQQRQAKIHSLQPVLNDLDIDGLMKFYDKRALKDDTDRALIEETISYKFDLLPDSAKKESLEQKWQELKQSKVDDLPPDQVEAHSQLLQAGTLKDYAEKATQLASIELAKLQGKSITGGVDGVVRSRLEHELSQFERAYGGIAEGASEE